MKSTAGWRRARVPVAVTAAAIAATEVVVVAVASKMTGFQHPVSVGGAAISDEREAVGLLFRRMAFWIVLGRRMAQRVELMALALLARGVVTACIAAAEGELVAVAGTRFLANVRACHWSLRRRPGRPAVRLHVSHRANKHARHSSAHLVKTSSGRDDCIRPSTVVACSLGSAPTQPLEHHHFNEVGKTRGCSRYAAAKPECERSFISCTATTCCAALATARSLAAPPIVPGRLPPNPLRLPPPFPFFLHHNLENGTTKVKPLPACWFTSQPALVGIYSATACASHRTAPPVRPNRLGYPPARFFEQHLTRERALSREQRGKTRSHGRGGLLRVCCEQSTALVPVRERW